MVVRPSLKRVVPGSVPPWRALCAESARALKTLFSVLYASKFLSLLESKLGQILRALNLRAPARAAGPRGSFCGLAVARPRVVPSSFPPLFSTLVYIFKSTTGAPAGGFLKTFFLVLRVSRKLLNRFRCSNPSSGPKSQILHRAKLARFLGRALLAAAEPRACRGPAAGLVAQWSRVRL